MNNERIKVLEMLQSGTINVEEAMALLKQFPEGEQDAHQARRHTHDRTHTDPRQINPNKAHGAPPPPPRPPRPHTNNDNFAGWAGDIANWAKNLADEIGNNVRESIADIDEDVMDGIRDGLEEIRPGVFLGGIFGGRGVPFSFRTDNLDSINSIKLLAKNGSIKIDESADEYLEIKGQFKPKDPDAKILFDQTDGNYQLLYDYDAMHSMQITCYVPAVEIDTIQAETKNAVIDVDDISKVRHLILTTKNASIDIDDVSEIGMLEANSRNGGIDVDDVQVEDLILTTSNSKIDLDDVVANKATLSTSNARVSIEDGNIAELIISTSNAGISLKEISHGDWEGERYIQATTSNGGILVEVPEDIGLEINAQTSRFSNIDCEIENSMILNSMSKNQLSCKSHDYDSFAQRMRLHLVTSNATIKIREE